MLDAARSLLLAMGPDVTTDEIASLAGVSKSTLYANFADKESLIEAVIRREADLTVTDEEFARLARSDVTADSLIKFGIRYVSFINSHDLLGWDRLIASLESSHPELPKRFFDLGPGRGQRLLTMLLAQAVQQEFLVEVEVDVAADILTGLWLGFVNLEVKLGVREPLTKDAIEERVRRGVSIFLQVYGNDSFVGAPGAASE
nr:TetR/AcrR family transcriptional regulator [Ensifer sp. IC4062]